MEESPWNSGKGWKITLGVLLLTAWVGMGTTFYLSVKRASRVADPNYYSHGLNYGKTASGARNPGMTWKMATSVTGSDLQVKVNDEAGAPVSGGKLSFVPERLGVAEGAPLTLAESAPGTFRVERPVTAEGELHGTLRFTKGEAVATQKLVLFN
jgi:hypothetical protein